MGRFFRTSSPQFLQGGIYSPPVELMMKVMQNDNQVRSLLEQQNAQTEQDLLTSPHLSFDADRLAEIQGKYKNEIDTISQMVYNDANALQKARPRMRELQKNLLLDKLNGPLGAITNRYNSFQKFIQDNKDVLEKDPGSYNLAVAYELNNLQSATEQDPMSSFSPYKIQASPEWRSEVTKEIDKLKANATKLPDGRGYLIGNKEVSPQRILELAVSNIMSKPQYLEFARQQTKFGQRGFVNADGGLLNPWITVDSRGAVVNPEDIPNMTDEQRGSLRRVVNPEWRYSNEVNSLANAYAYREQDMNPDSTYTTLAGISAANQRHAITEQRLRDQHNDRMALEEAKLAERASRGKGTGASGGTGSSGGNAPGNIQFEQYQEAKSLANDLHYRDKGSTAIDSRLQSVENSVRLNKSLQGIKVGNTNMAEIAGDLLNRGVNITNPSDNDRQAILDIVTSKLPKGVVRVGNKYINTAADPKEAARLLSEQIGKYTKDVVNSMYKDFSSQRVVSTGFGLDTKRAKDMLLNASWNKDKLKIRDERGNEVPMDIDNLLSEDGKTTIHYVPHISSQYGGGLAVTRVTDMGVEKYIVTGDDVENLVNNYGRQYIGHQYGEDHAYSVESQPASRYHIDNELYKTGTNYQGDALRDYGRKLGIPNLDSKLDGVNINLSRGVATISIIGKGAVEIPLEGINDAQRAASANRIISTFANSTE